MRQRSSLLLVVFMLLLAASATFFAVSSAYAAPVNGKTIHFSARLKGAQGAPIPDGYYNVSFRLYGTSQSGEPLWSETYYDENGVAQGQDYRAKVTNGYLGVQLGSRAPFDSSVNWNGDLWLTMNIGGTGQIGTVTNIPWDGEMSPRIQLGAVPYAMNAGALGGKTADDFIQIGGGTQTNSSDNPSISLNTTGNGSLVQLQRDAKDVFTIDTNGNISFGNGSDHKISIDQSPPDTDGKTLAISGGDGGDGDSNGGNIVLSGGSGSGTGANGLVVLASTAFSTAANDMNCYTGGKIVASSCSITQSTVDGSSAAIIGFSTKDQIATLPDPTLATPGRILYIMAANDSLPFLLILNGNEQLALQAKTALTMLWNGSDWVMASHNGAPSASTNVPQEPAITPDTETAPMAIGNEGSTPPVEIDTSRLPATKDEAAPTSPAATSAPFQLGQFESAPLAAPGTMYYDSTLGKVQCYEASGWGACGDAPDTFVAISPEYKNAVMNGTDIGIISSDFCSGTLGINDGSKGQPTVCGPNETYNFYRWTTEEKADQTRSIYLTYQLPDNFKGFISDSTAITGRSSSPKASASYQVYRDDGSGLTSCGNLITITTSSDPSWQRGLAAGASDPAACNFEAGDSILFRINLTARESASAYVSNVNFTFRNS